MNVQKDMKLIAARIRAERKLAGYTVEELAERTLLPVSVIRQAERGSTKVGFNNYIIILVVLGIVEPVFL